ncbi:interferon lambda receptor 1 [Myiozetetes cayanensis]|uniref:interferon lambda receptor 1 n=1 Tax=Myiozetetes cayanensis TaxID=478635 RepID=UPI00215E414C|nr:interferon lambda receptor 1 [Myiozetetes cayanensis]
MTRHEERRGVTSGVFSWRVGVLLALCFLHRAPGRVQLLPPQNVTLLSKDFEMILTWAPGGGSPQDVTYTVSYKSQDHMDKWLEVPHCNNISRTSCVLTCVLSNIYVKVRARVRAVSGPLQSPWVKSRFKDYYSEVELAPPELILNVKENSVHVSASFPLPTCMEKLIWKYELNHWEAGSEDEKKYEHKFRRDTVTIDTTALRGNYCFSARSIYDSIDTKYSEFSQPVCVPLNHKVKFPLSATIPVFALPIFLIGAFILCFLKQDAKQRKMPQTLDFRHLQAAGAAFSSELSKEEFCSDDLNCTEKPVAQRRADRALARNNPPGVASFLSSSPSPSSLDDDEEEEEEEEDSGTFIPYHQVTRFPKRHLHCQPPQAAQGKTSLDSGTGGLSGDSESMPDLSTSGFSSFPERKHEVDTSGSQADEEASLSHSCSLGRISLTDVRFPGLSEQPERGESLEMTLLQPLREGVCAKGSPGEPHPQEEGHHFTSCYQKSITELQVQIHGTSQLRKDQLLIPLHTLQVAEDEGISSDCDSDSFTEGTPPTSTVLSDTFEPPNRGDKHNPKLQFKGYSHAHYLGRT